MHPVLFELFDQTVPAYFAMLVVGFTLATYVGVRWAKASGFDHDTVIDLGLYSLIFGVAGARVLHVIADGYFWDYVHLCTDPSLVAWQISPTECAAYEGVWDTAEGVCRPAERDCFAWAAFWRGGLAYYGGLIAASIFGVRFLRKEGFPVLKGVDMAGMTIPLGLFWGRMGCYLGGCCFGLAVPGEHPLGVVFPPGSPASESQWKEGLLRHANLPSLPVHATQLYEAIGCLAISALLIFVWRPRKRFDGQLMLGFLALYALLRFGLEYLRADDRGALLGLSTSQLIGLAALAIVAGLWRVLEARGRRLAAGEGASGEVSTPDEPRASG